MLLSMDKNGNIYQAAGHRADGKGVERIPTLSGGGDLALENPYARAEAKRQKNQTLMQVHNAYEMLQEEVVRKGMSGAHKIKRAQDVARNEHILKSTTQQELLHEAVLQGMHGNADYNMLSYGPSALSGHGLTANGVRGKSQQQIATESALLQGMGAEPVLASQGLVSEIDKAEAEQYWLSLEAEKQKQMIAAGYALPVTAQSPGITSLAIMPPLEAPAGTGAMTEAVSSIGGMNTSDLLKYGAVAGLLYLVMRK